MKFGLAFLAVLILVGLVFAVETCVDCAEFVNAPNGRLFTVINNEALTLNIFAYYEDNGASPSRVPLNNTVLIIELTNSSGMEPELYKVYTDGTGQATFDFTTWSQACVDMKVLYCPFCANESANCGFAECLTFSSLHQEAGYYHNSYGIIPPVEQILNISSIPDGPGSIPKPSVLNDGKFLPDVTVSNYCAPPSTHIATPAMCLPLIIIFALLGGALYLTGQNPFGVFNLGSPRMGKHIKYQARGRGFSFSGMALVQAVSSVVGTVKEVAKAQEESAKDGKPPLTTAQAMRQVANRTAAGSVFLVSTANRISQASQSRAQTNAAVAAKGGTKVGQELRAAGGAGGGGSRVEIVGGQIRTVNSSGGTGASLMQKWGGGTSYLGNLAAGLTTIGVTLTMNLPIFHLAGICGFDPMKMIEQSGTKSVADAQANVQAQKDANGNLPVTTPDGKPVAVAAVEPTTKQEPKLDENGKPVLDANGKPVMVTVPGDSTVVTFVAPAKEEAPKAGEAPTTKVEAPAAAGTTQPATTEAPKAGETSKAEGEKQKVPEQPAQLKVDVKMDNNTGQVTGVSYDAPPTKDASGKEVPGAKVIAEVAPDGGTRLSVSAPGGESHQYTMKDGTVLSVDGQPVTIAKDGTATVPGADGKPVPVDVSAIKAMAAPATNGENVSGLKLGETPKMPTDWTGDIPILSKLTGAGNTDTFLDVCKEKAIQYQEASEKLSAALATHGGETYVKLGESLVDTPKDQERIKTIATSDAVNALALALGQPVETSGASKAVNKAEGEAALATTKALGEAVTHADLFRGGFGARAAESNWDALNPARSGETTDAIRITGNAIDGVIRTTPITTLEGMSPKQLEAALVHQLTTPEKPGMQPLMNETQARALLGNINLDHAVSSVNSAASELRTEMRGQLGPAATTQLESTSPRQFAQLCGSAVLIHNATEGDASSAAALVLRSNPETIKSLPPEQKALVAEYAAVEAARSTSARVGNNSGVDPNILPPISFNAVDRTASDKAQAASTHAIEIAEYRVLRSAADSLDEEHRKALPKDFEPVMKAHAEAFDTIAQANLAQIRLERAGLLDPLGSGTIEGTLLVQKHEQEFQGQLKERLGYGIHERDGTAGGVSSDAGPVSVGKVKVFDRDPNSTDYHSAAGLLAEQAQTYSIAGDQTTAEMYREALFSLTRAREADEKVHETDEKIGGLRKALEGPPSGHETEGPVYEGEQKQYTKLLREQTKLLREQERTREQELTQVETRLAPPEQVEEYSNSTLILAETARIKGDAALAKAREKAEKIAARDAAYGAVSRQIIDADGAEKPFH